MTPPTLPIMFGVWKFVQLSTMSDIKAFSYCAYKRKHHSNIATLRLHVQLNGGPPAHEMLCTSHIAHAHKLMQWRERERQIDTDRGGRHKQTKRELIRKGLLEGNVALKNVNLQTRLQSHIIFRLKTGINILSFRVADTG